MTLCKDCGVETKPGPGSARCKECWNDKNGVDTTNRSKQMLTHKSFRLNEPVLYWCKSHQTPEIITKISKTLFRVDYFAVNEEPKPCWTHIEVDFKTLKKIESWSKYKLIQRL